MDKPSSVTLRIDSSKPNAALMCLGRVPTSSLPEAARTIESKPGHTTELVLPNGQVVSGDVAVCRWIARTYEDSHLYGEGSVVSSSAIDAFVDGSLLSASFQLDTHLTLRTFVCGHQVSFADALCYALLPNNNASATHTRRWRNLMDTMFKSNTPTSSSSSSSTSNGEDQSSGGAVQVKLGAQGSFAKMELTDAKMGEVVVRFPPEPSGFLHVGHAKAVLLNDYYRQLYKGKLIVRFDDTNPAKEKTEYVEAILEDLATMGVKPDVVSYTSDYFAYILGEAKKLLEQGDAYVDDQDKETIRQQRFNRQDGPSRSLPKEEHLRRWEHMLLGDEYGRQCVLRARISMQHENSALRDPALARCVEHPHQRTGTQFKCYPTYDLAIATVDSLEGVTHAMRDSQYQERLPLYAWVLEKLKLRTITIRQFSRINFTHTLLSKRKLQFFVDKGYVTGWDDPALPTIRGIFNRGLTVDALRMFILSQGASVSRTNMSMNKLWAINKKLIDPIAPRFTAVSNDCYAVHLTHDLKEELKERPLHPKNNAVGKKLVRYGPKFLVESADARLLEKGEEFTLLDWGNAVLEEKDDDKKILRCRLNLAGDVKSTKRKVSWVVAAPESPTVKLSVIEDLITTETLPQQKEGEPEVDWTTVINPHLKHETLCCGEEALKSVQIGDKIQIVRRGFFIVHAAGGGVLHLVDIPSGKEGAASVLVDEKK